MIEINEPTKPFIELGRAILEQLEEEERAMEEILKHVPEGKNNAITLKELAYKLEIDNPYDNGLDIFIKRQIERAKDAMFRTDAIKQLQRTKVEINPNEFGVIIYMEEEALT